MDNLRSSARLPENRLVNFLRTPLAALMIVLFGAFLSVWAWHLNRDAVARYISYEAKAVVTDIGERVKASVEKYELILDTLAAVSERSVSPEVLENLLMEMNVELHLPSVISAGLYREEITAGGLTSGKALVRSLVSYPPLPAGKSEFGAPALRDTLRRALVQRAVSMSPRTILLNEEGQLAFPAVALVKPVFSNEAVPKHKGWVFVMISLEQFASQIIGDKIELGGASLVLKDVTGRNDLPPTVLIDSTQSTLSAAPDYGLPVVGIERVQVVVPDRVWHVELPIYESAGAEYRSQEPLILGLLSMSAFLLLFGLILTLLRAEKEARSEVIAGEEILQKTKSELTETVNEVRRVNSELDHLTSEATREIHARLRTLGHLCRWIWEEAGQVFSKRAAEDFDTLRLRVEEMESTIEALLESTYLNRVSNHTVQCDFSVLLPNVLAAAEVPDSFEVALPRKLPILPLNYTVVFTILRELVRNAVLHHGSDSGSIVIDLTQFDRGIQLSVSDNGRGIARKYHQAIFQTPNVESNKSARVGKDRFVGNAVFGPHVSGLVRVKKLVEQHHGAMQVISDAGEGCTLVLQLYWEVQGVEPRKRADSKKSGEMPLFDDSSYH